jgi:CubicO group peptidase (beta-lactamase class C family)
MRREAARQILPSDRRHPTEEQIMTTTQITPKRSTFTHLLRTVAVAAAISALAAPAAASGAPLVAELAPNLTRVYTGGDRSVLYLRAVGTKVVGFAEDPANQTAFVYEGTRSGSVITGRYFDVAKGKREDAGPLNLTSSELGAKLTRTGGEPVGAITWTAVSPSDVAMPKEREALFQSTTADDLDGAFEGGDASRAYVRETTADIVVSFAERYTSPEAVRPKWATVMIGQRNASGNLNGTFYDVPKGTDPLRTGAAVGSVSGKPRRFTQQLYEAQSLLAPIRSTTYSADYAIDFDRFAQEIEQRLSPFVVGYGYAITADERLMRANGGGSRRIKQPNNGVTDPLPYSEHTVGSIASASKTATLVTVVRALAARGISLDAPVDPYLPKTWVRGPGMKTASFRQLLSHGLQGNPAPACPNGDICVAKQMGLFHPPNCDDNRHNCLRDAIAGGMTANAGYDNIHYSVMRVILPFVTKKAEMQALFDTETDGDKLAEAYSAVFDQEVRAMLNVAGVNAGFSFPVGYDDVAYRYTWGDPPTGEVGPDKDPGPLAGGAGGLEVTPVQYAWFLARLENGVLLSPGLLAEIKAMGFGQTSWRNGTDDIGPLYGKDGASDGNVGAYAMVYPGDVQAFITHNSGSNDDMPGRDSIMRAAWLAALI